MQTSALVTLLVGVFHPTFNSMLHTFPASCSTTSFFFLGLNGIHVVAYETALTKDCFDLKCWNSIAIASFCFRKLFSWIQTWQPLVYLMHTSGWLHLHIILIVFHCPLSSFSSILFSTDKINRCPYFLLYMLCIPSFWPLVTLALPYWNRNKWAKIKHRVNKYTNEGTITL